MSWDLIQLTDFHIGRDKQQACRGSFPVLSLQDVIKDISLCSCSHYVATGDLSDDGSASSYRHIEELLEPIKHNIYLLPGNHDDSALMKSILGHWPMAFRTHCDIRQWRVIFLNSTLPGYVHGGLNKNQLSLLVQLAMPWDGNIVVMMHHHCHDDAIRQQAGNAGKGVSNMDEFVRAITPYKDKVKAVFSGHVHRESKQILDGIECYTTPATIHYADNGTRTMPGYRWLRFHRDTFDTGVVYVKSHAIDKN
jgi:3',5'-cyclic-AMP phosphodiesterase